MIKRTGHILVVALMLDPAVAHAQDTYEHAQPTMLGLLLPFLPFLILIWWLARYMKHARAQRDKIARIGEDQIKELRALRAALAKGGRADAKEAS